MKLVIFDVDGTLVNSRHHILAAFHETFDHLGLPRPEDSAVADVIGLSLTQACQKLIADKAAARAAATYYAENYMRIQAALMSGGPALYAGVGELLAELKDDQRFALGLATGNSRRGVRRLLDTHQWHNWFATIQTADDAPSKPHPAMVRQAMAELGVSGDDTFMVGDTAWDVSMGVAAGANAIGVTWGYHPEAQLVAAGARFIARRLPELRETLLGLAE
ncbi:MAG: HAD-IA family hydrolase [Methylobacteriaceae bacterium]|jgi:phosphoglycolate phosphatase|nr:HAD-IA family hydrolase [Methylobacteriaceae bacterium]